MKIKRIKIQNFRSIKSLEFFPASVCALVGENGVGKTNILAALDFLLGEKWPSNQRLEVSDYFQHDERREIFVGIEFEQNAYDIQFICFKQGFEKGQNRIGYFSNPCTDLKQAAFLKTEHREKCAMTYLEASRDLDRHLGTSPWTLFGRITSQFNADFPEASIEPLEAHFEGALELLRTPRFQQFEAEIETAFRDQLKRTTHNLRLEFKAFDPQSYYRSINLVLRRGKDERLRLPEAGQGMRNLALLALFRAYATVFKGDAIIAIEEPEIYLHPHAQRSLASLFNDLAERENQVFFSTHASSFVDLEHFDQVCLVERCVDDDGEQCTTVRQVSAEQFLEERQKLHPSISMTTDSVKKRLHNISRLEHSEVFFARKAVLVEGETEQYALPIFADCLSYNLDSFGVSIINAGGKNNLDQFFQLYNAFGIPVYVIFDNDQGKPDKELEQNRVLLRMLHQPETLNPEPEISATYAVLNIDFETEMRNAIGSENYDSLCKDAAYELGSNPGKGLRARYMAQRLADEGIVPNFISDIVRAIRVLGDIDVEVANGDFPEEFPF